MPMLAKCMHWLQRACTPPSRAANAVSGDRGPVPLGPSVIRDLVAGHVVLRALAVVLPARAARVAARRLVERCAGRGRGVAWRRRLRLTGLAGRPGPTRITGGQGAGRYQH